MELTENEQKKAYLRKYQRAVRREMDILEEIQRLRSDKMFPSVVNDGMPKGNEQSDLSSYMAMLDEQINLLKQERLEKIRLYSDIAARIKALEDDNEREVLWQRYIKGLSWEKVCVEIGYSWRQTHNIHSRALKHIDLKSA